MTRESTTDGRVQGEKAEALVTRGVLAMRAGRADEVLEAMEELWQFQESRPGPEVAKATATLLGCVIEWFVASVQDPRPAMQALGRFHGLLDRFGAERPVAQSFAVSCEFVLLMLLILKDEPGIAAHLQHQQRIAERFPGDDELVFNMARSLVNGVVQRCDAARSGQADLGLWAGVVALFRAPPPDPVLDGLQRTLELFMGSCPESARIADARGRFERATGRRLQARRSESRGGGSVSSRDATPAPHPDIQRLREAFSRLQESPADQGALSDLLSILGTGGYPRRVMQEGEGVYEKDEPYFLNLAIELRAQVASDRCGFWRMNAHLLRMLTP